MESQSTQNLVVKQVKSWMYPIVNYIYQLGIAITLFIENLQILYFPSVLSCWSFPSFFDILVWSLSRKDPITKPHWIQFLEDLGQNVIQRRFSRIFRISLSRIIVWISTSCHVSPGKGWGSGGSASLISCWPVYFSKPRAHLEMERWFKPRVEAALVMESCHCHSFSPRGLLHTGLLEPFLPPSSSAHLRKWARFSRGVVYSKLHTALLALSPSLWLTCVCSDVGGGPRKARTTSRCTRTPRCRPATARERRK